MSAERAAQIDDLDQLAERLQEHFRTVVKRGYRTPDIESCRSVAGWLCDYHLQPPPDPDVAAILKLGRSFLGALTAYRPKLSAIVADWQDPGGADIEAQLNKLRFDTEMFLRLLESDVLLPVKDWREIPSFLSRLTGRRAPDMISIVADLARQAWAKANDGVIPKRAHSTSS